MNKNIRLVRIPELLISAGKIILPGLFEPLFGSVILNNDQTLKVLDFHPPVTTEEGISRMVKAYLSK
jgi:nucleoside-diphosphate-sugar epimerase